MSFITSHQLFVKQGNTCPFNMNCPNGVCCMGECIKPSKQKFYEKIYYLSQCKHKTHSRNSERIMNLDIKIVYCKYCRQKICTYCELVHDMEHQKEIHESKLSICQNKSHQTEIKKMPIETIFQLYIMSCEKCDKTYCNHCYDLHYETHYLEKINELKSCQSEIHFLIELDKNIIKLSKIDYCSLCNILICSYCVKQHISEDSRHINNLMMQYSDHTNQSLSSPNIPNEIDLQNIPEEIDLQNLHSNKL